jgi:nicotinate phosphoribosyltransferase
MATRSESPTPATAAEAAGAATDARAKHAARSRAFHEDLVRFPARLFQFDPRMRVGWYSDRYFVRTARTLAHAGAEPVVCMQVFAKQQGIVAGVFEVVRMLQTQLAIHPVSGREYRLHDLAVDALMDGDEIHPWEPVLHITGPYIAFAHLETDYLGVLARRSLVASNVRRVITAAAGKPVIFMGARHDDWRVQTPDGYAARVGGAGSVSSDAGGWWWGAEGVGTMPHAMIAAFCGDVVKATLEFASYCRDHEPTVRVVSLVDYHNDVIGDSLAVARAMRDAFGPGSLAAVRVDTSEKLVDRSLDAESDGESPELRGVNPRLVRKLRDELDTNGFAEVGIIVSGGFNPTKIGRFESEGVPVSGYGIGSSLLGHNHGEPDGLLNNFDYTADIVMVDGHLESKEGREFMPNERFVRLDPDLLERLDRTGA